jgi:hypothetical protein
VADYKVEPSRESMVRLLQMAKAAGPTLKKKLYEGIRLAAEPAAQAARDKVMGELPPKADQRGTVARLTGRAQRLGSSRGHTGLRQNIARGVSVSINSSGKSAGVRISSSAVFLTPSQRAHGMNRVYNLETFRHPIFGGRKTAAQHGIRWFYGPISSKKNAFTSAVLRAMQETADELSKL